MNNDQEQDRGEFAPCPIEAQTVKYWEANSVINMENFVGSGKPVPIREIKAANQFKPDYNTEAVLVEEMQRMAKRIEDLEAMLTRQTARIVDLQTHIENFEGEL